MRTSRINDASNYSRVSKKQRSGLFGGTVIILLLLACVLGFLFFGAGDWLNTNVVTPVLAFFNAVPSNDPAVSTPLENDEANSKNSLSPANRLNDNIQIEPATYYLLQGGIYSDLTNAAVASREVLAKGGGGYIFMDGEKKRVILSPYLSDTDAKTVRDRLKASEDMDTYVYALNLPSFSITMGANSEQLSVIKDAFYFPDTTIRELIEISEGYDKSENMTERLNSLVSKTDTLIASVQKILPGNEDNLTLSSVLNFTVDFGESIKKFPTNLNTKTMEISAQLKYNITELIDIYQKFVSELQ